MKTNRTLFLIKAWIVEAQHQHSEYRVAHPEPQAAQKQAAPQYLHIADGQLAEELRDKSRSY